MTSALFWRCIGGVVEVRFLNRCWFPRLSASACPPRLPPLDLLQLSVVVVEGWEVGGCGGGGGGGRCGVELSVLGGLWLLCFQVGRWSRIHSSFNAVYKCFSFLMRLA